MVKEMNVSTDKKFSDMTAEESLAECAKVRHEIRKERKEPTAILKTFSQIKEKPLEWLWDKHIPLSMFCIFAGDPGLGKSTLSLDISARLSQGIPFPDNSPSMTGDVLILAGEDDPAYTIKPRLQALGADMDRIHILTEKRGEQGDGDFSVKDTGVLLDAIDQIRARSGNLRLVIIDPLESFIGGTVDTYRNNEVRAALRGMIALAQKERFTIIAIQHLTKKQGISANHRISGSIAFVAAARTVWMVTKDPENPHGCLFLNSKMNIAQKNEGYQYSMESSVDGIGVPAWGNRVNTDPDDVLNTPPSPKAAPEQEAIIEYLRSSELEGKKLADIAEAVGNKNPSSVSNILKKLEKQNKVHSPRYGYWALKQVSLSSPPPIGEKGESETPQNSHPQFYPVKIGSETVKQEMDIF